MGRLRHDFVAPVHISNESLRMGSVEDCPRAPEFSRPEIVLWPKIRRLLLSAFAVNTVVDNPIDKLK
jgi:hypothetical protein